VTVLANDGVGLGGDHANRVRLGVLGKAEPLSAAPVMTGGAEQSVRSRLSELKASQY
jgi:hypothetical protein